ncbi:MAG TPA: ferritin-like domain-containing protein [Gemmatimonadota bacterium]|nr:ferritin-like domain-containing protein [Gemmatimonadota bacterium]
MKTLGAGGTIVLLPGVFTACDDDDDPIAPPEGVTLDFGSDFGVLNYAYALEQLEAAFYTQVVANFYANASADEQTVLTDLRDHEVAHRDFFQAALGDEAIPTLDTDFSGVNFSDRSSVLMTAMTFEDLGVAAYNGAAMFLSDPDFLTVAGKIVSVEARHASVIRTLLGVSFAPDAFDMGMAPSAVLTAADPFIDNDISVINA